MWKLLLLFSLLTAAGCSSSAVNPAGFDAGSKAGSVNEACKKNDPTGCDNIALICVNAADPHCRTRCVRDAGPGGCGPSEGCFPIGDGDDAACLPANTAGDPCPCSDGNVCVDDPNQGDVCLTACEPDGGPEACPTGERCRPLVRGPAKGACL